MKTALIPLAAALSVTAFAATPVFETPREFTASGDFNGDGFQDVLILDKVTGLYRIGTGNGTTNPPAYANARPTGVPNATSATVGKLNGIAFDSFAVTAPAQNRVQVLSPTTGGYTEPKTIVNAGVGTETLCAVDITTGASPTPEDDLGVIVSSDPTLHYAVREIRSNAGAWSIVDTGSCPEFATNSGNPVPMTAGASPFMGFMRNDGATDSFHVYDLNGAGFTEKLVWNSLAVGTTYVTVPFQSPNVDLVFYVPGTLTVHVRRITPSGPNWVLGSDDITTFTSPIAQMVPVKDVGSNRVAIRFTNGSVALYSYTLAGGFSPPTTIAPTGATGVLSGIVPMNGSAQFQLLYASAAGQPSSTAVTFANSGSGWTQTGITTLPTVNVYSSYANVLLLSGNPFRTEYVTLQRSYKAADWSTGVAVGSGPFTVTAQAASYLGMTQGIGAASAQNVGDAGSGSGGTAVNQLHQQFSMVSFEQNLGPAVDDVTISPASGSYSHGIQITFSGMSGGSSVRYRLGSSGAFQTWNSASPPWVFTSGQVYYYVDKPGSGPSTTKTASYSFSVPPALQDQDGDGVPDFVEVARGLDPAGGADSDKDGFTDADELAAGSDPNNAASTPSSKASALGTMTVDASVQMKSSFGALIGQGSNETLVSLYDPLGNIVGSEKIGHGGAATYYCRITALNATGDRGYLVARSAVNYGTTTSSTEHYGREMAGIVPLPEEDGWSFGSTQGTFVTTGTTWSWGGTNWASSTTNWNGITDTSRFDDAWSTTQQAFTFAINGASAASASWLPTFVNAANRGGQPYVKIALSPETTLAALILREKLSDLFIARGITPGGDSLTLTGIVSPRDLRSASSSVPTAPVARTSDVVSYIDTTLKASDTGATALRKLARDVYARSQALSDDNLSTMTAPISALHTYVTTGALPTEYQTGAGLSSTEFTNALAKLNEILGTTPTRPTASLTLYTRSSASPAGLTLVQNSSGSTMYALFDSHGNPVLLPSDVSLPTGTSLIVNAYTDLPVISSYTGLEVISLSISALPNTIDTDSDGDLLADSWEMRHFGTLAFGTYDHGDGSAYSLGEEYFRSTDPRDASSSPAGPPTALVFTAFEITTSGSPALRATWPAAYASFINVDFQASDDLSTWTYPSGFSATDLGGGVFGKSFSFDRARRFFRPVASLKR